MIQIEKASLTDADTLVRLNQHVHRLHMENASRFFKQPTEAESQLAMQELLAQTNAQAFIAYSDGQAVGYILFMIRKQAENVFSPGRRWLYVDQISVEPEWLKHGIGRQLLQAVFDIAREVGIEELEVDTWAFNARAQAFFKSFGFQPKIIRHWMRVEA